MNDLSDVFGETEETEVENSVTASTDGDGQTESQEAGPDGGTTDEESTVEDSATTTVAEQDEAKPDVPEGYIPIAAKQDETRKRQEAEERVRALEERLQALESGEPPEVDEYAQELEAKFDQKLKAAVFQERLKANTKEVQSSHEDYPAMESIFIDLAKKNPSLGQQMAASEEPAQFVYTTAKNYTLLSEYGGDVEKLVEAKLAEAKSLGIQPSETPVAKEKRPKTPSLATATESEKNSAPPAPDNTLSSLFEDSQL